MSLTPLIALVLLHPYLLPKPSATTARAISFHPDLTYSVPEAGPALQLDLARPVGEGPFPAVVFLHGGGWVVGSRKTYRPLIRQAAREGYVAVTVSYRLAPRYPFPAAVHDAKAAVRWLRANAAKYRIDPERIGVVGYSAGGTLACLLGTTPGKSFFEGKAGCAEQSSRVQAVVSCYAPSDLGALYSQCQTEELPLLERTRLTLALLSYLGGAPAQAGRRYAQASPITHVSEHAAPTLLIHGTADHQVPLRQSELLEQRLKKAGVEVTLLRLKGADHNFTGAFEEEATLALFRFLGRHLKCR